ncbi:alpha/beta hydrolase fold protein [Stackebrandtia nassauensis DSM 44728]|uniref:Alpha/beta hydrolase fold protein n=2 Tax=Stackebrandtia TaxID=283810 RepID=D3Q9C6_STANL|nr:alpha/beta hydrolase fold protein [Stackebrandtia nassauensis DSM 44728]
MIMNEVLIPVEGGHIWADDSGTDGPVVVLLHPGVGDSRIWEPILPRLTARYRVIRYDVRGYGRSPKPAAAFTYYGDFLSVVEHFGLDRVRLVGCSMGGGVASTFAVEQPQRVESLVLLCPGFPGFDWPEDDTDAEMEALIKAADVNGLALLGMRLWARSEEDLPAWRQLQSAAAGWLAEAEFLGEEPPVFDRLGEVSAPTVLMVGDLDLSALIDSNVQASERIPGCRLVWMPGVDHLPPLREPGWVADTIVKHFEGTQGS